MQTIRPVQIDYPFHYDSSGRTATAGNDEHIRDLIEQVLFTIGGASTGPRSART